MKEGKKVNAREVINSLSKRRLNKKVNFTFSTNEFVWTIVSHLPLPGARKSPTTLSCPEKFENWSNWTLPEVAATPARGIPKTSYSPIDHRLPVKRKIKNK